MSASALVLMDFFLDVLACTGGIFSDHKNSYKKYVAVMTGRSDQLPCGKPRGNPLRALFLLVVVLVVSVHLLILHPFFPVFRLFGHCGFSAMHLIFVAAFILLQFILFHTV